MKKSGRYKANSAESEYEPGSNGLVLKNRLAIQDQNEIELLETEKLLSLTSQVVESFDQDQKFTVSEIQSMHRIWLDSIYEWAGEYRTVNMSKDDFTFAAAHLIPGLMKEFEAKVLALIHLVYLTLKMKLFMP